MIWPYNAASKRRGDQFPGRCHCPWPLVLILDSLSESHKGAQMYFIESRAYRRINGRSTSIRARESGRGAAERASLKTAAHPHERPPRPIRAPRSLCMRAACQPAERACQPAERACKCRGNKTTRTKQREQTTRTARTARTQNNETATNNQHACGS